jgi:hypothetical protein
VLFYFWICDHFGCRPTKNVFTDCQIFFQYKVKGSIFTQFNVRKIGLNSLSNRVSWVSAKINVDWPNLTHSSFKKLARKIFVADIFDNLTDKWLFFFNIYNKFYIWLLS